MSWTSVKRFLPLGAIIFLASILRFVYLDRIPTAMSGDELHYVLTAKSVWLTGHDITGTWNPLSVFLFRYPPGEQQAELPYFLHLPFSGPFPFSLFAAKLPFSVLSVGIVLLLYAIACKLFGRIIGIATGLVAAVNPWLVVMGRTGYESTPATFFYLLALWILMSTSSWGVLWSLIPFILAFYSYIGTKLIFIPFVILAIILSYRKQKKYSCKPHIVLILTCIVFMVFFVFLVRTSPAGSRISEIFLPFSPAVASQVNEIRKTAIQSPLLPVLINKYTVYGQILFSKIFRIFSPTYLFLEGDQFFLPTRQSFFYYVDFIFIIFGMLSLFVKNRKYLFILAGFIVVGTLPHIFNTTTGDFSGHLALMFPFMILFIGVGVSDCITFMKGRFRPVFLACLTLIYALNIASFSLIYFYQYPLIGAGDFPMRVLTKYLNLTSQTNLPIIIYSNRGGDLFNNYIFYSNAMERETLPAISAVNTRPPFEFNTIRFTDCDEGVKTVNPPIITIYDTTCMMNINEPRVYISTLKDSGRIYGIYNDTICRKYSLNAYLSGILLSDLALERLSREKYCKTFITL